ncbi:MAG: hypothetical protein H0W25_10935 [Acidimicrobiia bacterium]|nr:hypothetical protein [Acidimicrobiia bacterium]
MRGSPPRWPPSWSPRFAGRVDRVAVYAPYGLATQALAEIVRCFRSTPHG